MDTLQYVRRATWKRDGASGYIYMHHWSTGWQELIFESAEDAKAWHKQTLAQGKSND